MSLDYTSTRAYCPKFDESKFLPSIAACVEYDFKAAAEIISVATPDELQAAALAENGELFDAIKFLTACAWDVKYYRKQAEREAIAKGAADLPEAAE